MLLEKALQHFEQAEEFALRCGNKNNVNLLREAQQCLKTWMEKREANADRSSSAFKGSHSDESLKDESP